MSGCANQNADARRFMVRKGTSKPRKKVLIVDGYNVLRSGSRYRAIRADDEAYKHDPDYAHTRFNNVRESLISDVAAFAGALYQATIVFDAGDNAESAGKTERIAGVRVMFSPFGSSADKVIEKLAHDARERGCEVLVVTSDATIQDTVFGGGVDRMSANGFSLEMDEISEEAELDRNVATHRKATIADRVDADTYAKLIALRDRKH